MDQLDVAGTVPFPVEILEQAGFTEYAVLPPVLPHALVSCYQNWVGHGRHGGSAYLEKSPAGRFDATALVPGAAAVIVVAVNYYRPAGPLPDGSGRVACFARGRDYHKVLLTGLRRVARELETLFPGQVFQPGVDAVPLAERSFALAGGLGVRGRNGLLINPRYGSWVVLGEIVTTVPFVPIPASVEQPHSCGNCRRCIDACPTGALQGDGTVDAGRCLSFITVESRGPVPEALQQQLGMQLFGCDICQEVCPANANAVVAESADFLRDYAGDALPLDALLGIRSDAEFTARFAGSQLMRSGRRGMLRNAAVVAANLRDLRLLPRLKELTRDGDAVVADQAARSVRKIAGE